MRTKGWWRTWLLIVCLLWQLPAGLSATAHAEGTTFPWLTHTLRIESIRVNPDNVLENPDPANVQYVLIRIAAEGDGIPIAELIENLEGFYLTDASGTEYPQNAFMPYAMAYNERGHVLMTAMTQTKFDLFFALPASISMDTYTLTADETTIALSDVADVIQ